LRIPKAVITREEELIKWDTTPITANIIKNLSNGVRTILPFLKAILAITVRNRIAITISICQLAALGTIFHFIDSQSA